MSTVRHIGSARHAEHAPRLAVGGAVSSPAVGQFGGVMDAALAASPNADASAKKDGKGRQDNQPGAPPHAPAIVPVSAAANGAETAAAIAPNALATSALGVGGPLPHQKSKKADAGSDPTGDGAITMAVVSPNAPTDIASSNGASVAEGSPETASASGSRGMSLQSASASLPNNVGSVSADAPPSIGTAGTVSTMLPQTRLVPSAPPAASMPTTMRLQGSVAPPTLSATAIDADASVRASLPAIDMTFASGTSMAATASRPGRPNPDLWLGVAALRSDATQAADGAAPPPSLEQSAPSVLSLQGARGMDAPLAAAFAAADQALVSAQDGGAADDPPDSSVSSTVAARMPSPSPSTPMRYSDLTASGAPLARPMAAERSRFDPQAAEDRAGDDVTLLVPQAIDDAAAVGAAYNAIGASPDPSPAGVTVAASVSEGLSPSQPAGFGEGVAHQILSMIGTGRQEATLQLHPPELGAITVRLAVAGHDVSAWFGSAQPQVQEALSQGMTQLRGELANAGLNLANAWVGSDAAPGRQPLELPPGPRRVGIVPSPGITPPIATEPTTRAAGVSIYV